MSDIQTHFSGLSFVSAIVDFVVTYALICSLIVTEQKTFALIATIVLAVVYGFRCFSYVIILKVSQDDSQKKKMQFLRVIGSLVTFVVSLLRVIIDQTAVDQTGLIIEFSITILSFVYTGDASKISQGYRQTA